MALKTIIFASIFTIFVSCSNHTLNLPEQTLSIYDKQKSYDVDVNTLKESYLKEFFSPFTTRESGYKKEDLSWALNMAYKIKGYGENLIPYTKKEIDEISQKANLSNFPNTKPQPAIVVYSSNIRALPTNKPFFKNPNDAGEGFPFDYFQTSYIYSNTPILVKHYSNDRSWAFIESGFVSGWMEVKNIAKITNTQIKNYMKSKFVTPTSDYISLAHKDNFIEYARVGMIYPIYQNKLVIFSKNKDGFATQNLIEFNKEEFLDFPINFSDTNYISIANKLMGEKYGWGGMFGNRDCSMFLRDTLGVFGFYLPRNSQAQIKIKTKDSRYYNLDNLDSNSKKNFIKNNGIPFATLLGMKGHIMLYIGERDGNIFVLHDVWGLKTLQKETIFSSKETRHIIGKIAITPIDIGKDMSNVIKDSLLIDRIYGMVNLIDMDR